MPFAATLISANPIEEDVAIVPNEDEKEILSPVIEDSKAEELPAQGRLFFVQAYATSYVTTATSTLSTYTSCYSTLNAAPVCSSSVLSGKRKRQAEFLNETPRMLMDNGETTDFRDYIKASRVNNEKIENHPKSQCLKIIENVAFNILSEASYIYMFSGQKLIKNAKNGQFSDFSEMRLFW